MPVSVPRSGSEADHLRFVLEHSGIGAWELDIRNGSAWRNRRHDEIFGYPEGLEEWTYDMFVDHVVEADRPAVRERYGRSLAEGEPWSFQCRIRRPDGEERWISVRGTPLRDEEGEVEKFIGHVLDITDLKRDEERLRTISHELNHRVRNTLTIVQSLATRSFPDDRSVAEGRRAFIERIEALASAHSILTDESWIGAPIPAVVRSALLPFCGDGEGRCSIEGPDAWLPAKTAVSLTMALHELATNALKHGALSTQEGRIAISWACSPHEEGQLCEMTWIETGGPAVREPEGTGFGMTLIKGLMPTEPEGKAEISFPAEGVKVRLTFLAKSGHAAV